MTQGSDSAFAYDAIIIGAGLAGLTAGADPSLARARVLRFLQGALKALG